MFDTVELRGCKYTDVKFLVMHSLLWYVKLGRDFLIQHESVRFKFGSFEPVRLFEHLSPNCRPLTTKRRNYSKADQSFISSHISQLLEDNIIEISSSPWRAQVVVVKNSHKKKKKKNACALTIVKQSTKLPI